MKELYTHPVLGELTINRSPRASRLSILVRPSGVTVTLPARCSLREAMLFVDAKQQWIRSALERAKKRLVSPALILPPFSSRLYTLNLTHQEDMRFDIRIKSGIIGVSYPASMDPRSEEVQKIVRKALEETWRIEAKVLLPEWVSRLAAQHGFRFSGLSVRNAVTRWGSCSGSNSISLSLHLMRLPDYLIDYIVLHELCHTVHKNHGPKFHALLNKVTAGKHPELRKELCRYSPRW